MNHLTYFVNSSSLYVLVSYSSRTYLIFQVHSKGYLLLLQLLLDGVNYKFSGYCSSLTKLWSSDCHLNEFIHFLFINHIRLYFHNKYSLYLRYNPSFIPTYSYIIIPFCFTWINLDFLCISSLSGLIILKIFR